MRLARPSLATVAAGLFGVAVIVAIIDPTHAQVPRLREDQKRAVELSIAGTEPSQRPFMYEMMAKNLAQYDEKQIAQLVKALEQTVSKEQLAEANKAHGQHAPGALSAADSAHNRAQYEPVIRKHWAAHKAFDKFVDAKIAEHCPTRAQVARWGSAWRYELLELTTLHYRSSDNVEANISVWGSTYAPQDGKYKFDFSKVRYTWDQKATEAAIKQACTEYKALGVQFLARLDPLIAKKDWEGAHRLEQAWMPKVEPIRVKMDTILDKLSPDAGHPVMTALQNGVRVR